MYRRRINKSNVKPVEQHEEKKEKKEPVNEPVIRAVVSNNRGDPTKIETLCPMLNTLRGINYLRANNTNMYPIDFSWMVDIALSSGYLKFDFDVYSHVLKLDDDGKTVIGKTNDMIVTGATTWSQIYTDTTTYNRPKGVIAGDVIYGKSEKIMFAFLVTKTYVQTKPDDTISEAVYDPPVDAVDEPSADPEYMSSCVGCTGNVWPFKAGVTFEDIEDYISKDASGAYRVLAATNVSKFDHVNSAVGPSGWTSRGDDEPEAWCQKMPQKDKWPTQPASTPEVLSNSYITAYGWFIYMYCTEGTTAADKVVGDIIRTGPLPVATGDDFVSIGNCITFKIDLATKSNSKLIFKGGSNSIVTEPLNSEHYQNNFGDSQGEVTIELEDCGIETLSVFAQNN